VALGVEGRTGDGKATADPYGMTNKRTSNDESKNNDEIQGSFTAFRMTA
jgi:hypothetical protein